MMTFVVGMWSSVIPSKQHWTPPAEGGVPSRVLVAKEAGQTVVIQKKAVRSRHP